MKGEPGFPTPGEKGVEQPKNIVEKLQEVIDNRELSGEDFEKDKRYEEYLFKRLESIVRDEMNVQPFLDEDNVYYGIEELKDTIRYNDAHLSYTEWDKYISKESKKFLEDLGLIEK